MLTYTKTGSIEEATIVIRPLGRRQFVGLTASALALGEFNSAEAGLLDFFKRLARAIGFITGPGLIAKMWKGGGLDNALRSAVNKQLALVQQAGLNVSDEIIQSGANGLTGVHSILSAGQNAQTARTLPSGGYIRLAAATSRWPDEAGLFFEQRVAGANAQCTALRGPSIHAVQHACEHFLKQDHIDPAISPNLIQQVLLPLKPHKISFGHSFSKSYSDLDFYDSATGRVGLLYHSVSADTGIAIVNVADPKTHKISYSRQFIFHLPEHEPDGFPLHDEKPSAFMISRFQNLA